MTCVINQTYQNLEIILIDDGSPDSSGEICEEFAEKDARIKVIHKENGGAATARNVGLDAMTGEYVTFVDADDYMELNYIETLYQLLSENKTQVSACGFYTVDEDGNTVVIDELHNEELNPIQSKESKIYTGNGIILQDLQGHWEHVAPWGKLFSADLYQGIRYPKWIAYEDEPVFIQVFDKVQTAVVSPKKLYYYVQHKGSLMNTDYSEKARSTTLKMWRERISYYQDEEPKHKELLNCIKQAFVAWNVLYLSLHGHEMTKEQEKELKTEIRHYFWSLFRGPYLFDRSYSIKLAVKCIMTLMNTNILRKRYKK